MTVRGGVVRRAQAKSLYIRNYTSAGMDRFSSCMASTTLSAMTPALFRADYLEKVWHL